MKKGFTLIEVIIGMLFGSVILLSFITIFLNIHKTLEHNSENSIIYEKLKYIDKTIEDQINNLNFGSLYLDDNKLFNDYATIIDYHNNQVVVYNNNIPILQEEVDCFNINVVNENLVKLEFGLNGKTIERYYYIGGQISET